MTFSRLYRYHGSISQASMRNMEVTSITLHQLGNDRRPPIQLAVFGSLAQYLYELECSDYEERYIDSDFYFDSMLHLARIEIPSTDPSRPARIIARRDPLDSEIRVYGGKVWDFLDDPNPEPMSIEEYRRFLQEIPHCRTYRNPFACDLEKEV